MLTVYRKHSLPLTCVHTSISVMDRDLWMVIYDLVKVTSSSQTLWWMKLTKQTMHNKEEVDVSFSFVCAIIWKDCITGSWVHSGCRTISQTIRGGFQWDCPCSIFSNIMLRTIYWTELWQMMNLGAITTNQKSNNKANSGNIPAPQLQRSLGWCRKRAKSCWCFFFFLDMKGLFLSEFLARGQTMNTDQFCNILNVYM